MATTTSEADGSTTTAMTDADGNTSELTVGDDGSVLSGGGGGGDGGGGDGGGGDGGGGDGGGGDGGDGGDSGGDGDGGGGDSGGSGTTNGGYSPVPTPMSAVDNAGATDSTPIPTAEFNILNAGDPGLYKFSRDGASEGWELIGSFFAYTSQAEGTVQFNILDAQDPHRYKLSTDGAGEGWSLQDSFWAFASDPGDGVAVQYHILDAQDPHRYKVNKEGAGAGWAEVSSFWAYTTAPASAVPTFSPTETPFASCDELGSSGELMACYNFGDPHFTTFSNQKHNAMGHGEYILMQADEASDFAVHVCHQPGDKPEVSQNTGVAITSQWGVLKFNHQLDSSRPTIPDGSGITLRPHTPSFGINTITFPSGEIVETQNAGGVTTVMLPARYCGNVHGLCGAYDPEEHFASTFAVNDAGFSVFSGSSTQLWGGPYGGEFQSQFAESWKVVATDSDALFTAEECPSGDSYTGDAPEPFADCPGLETEAVAQCPAGDLYELCFADVGIMCDLDKWVGQALDMVEEKKWMLDDDAEAEAEALGLASPPGLEELDEDAGDDAGVAAVAGGGGDSDSDSDSIAVFIPTGLVLSDQSHLTATVGDWYKVVTTVSGSTNIQDFPDKLSMSYKNALESALNGIVPVTSMILLIESAADGLTVSCSLVIPKSFSDAVAASLSDAAFADSFTAAALAEGISINRVRCTKVVTDTGTASFESLFGISAPVPEDLDYPPDLDSTISLRGVKQSSGSSNSSADQTGKFAAVAIIGVLCIALVASAVVKARGHFSKTEQLPSAAVVQIALSPAVNAI
jgi:hypothetical protein